MTTPARDVAEIVRAEHLMRRKILAALADGPRTIPEIAAAIGHPTREVVFWVMGLRRYGHLAESKDSTDEGYYRYRAVEGQGTR